MAYATTTELAEYLGVQVADLPDDADRLLERASEMIDYYTLNKIDEEDAEVAKKATMAQYEWWAEFDEFGSQQFFDEMTIGPFTARNRSGGNRQGGAPELAPRARRFLFLEGLMYRGVNIR